MQITVRKGARSDTLELVRADGSRATTSFPKKGWFPHDVVHYCVEQALGFERAFWGRVAAGTHPDEVAKLAREAGHPSAKRARAPDPAIVELLQAERLVECIETELWSAPADLDTFTAVLEAACRQSQVPAPALSDALLGAIRQELADLGARWRALRDGEALQLTWSSR